MHSIYPPIFVLNKSPQVLEINANRVKKTENKIKEMKRAEPTWLTWRWPKPAQPIQPLPTCSPPACRARHGRARVAPPLAATATGAGGWGIRTAHLPSLLDPLDTPSLTLALLPSLVLHHRRNRRHFAVAFADSGVTMSRGHVREVRRPPLHHLSPPIGAGEDGIHRIERRLISSSSGDLRRPRPPLRY